MGKIDDALALFLVYILGMITMRVLSLVYEV